MNHAMKVVTLILAVALLVGCAEDRENPVATTEADVVLESYLAHVQKLGELLGDVRSEPEAKAVTPKILLIVEDMRGLLPRMKAISIKEQADAVSKYRVKSNIVNEQFAKDITRFVEAVPDASEDLMEQLKNMPPIIEDETSG